MINPNLNNNLDEFEHAYLNYLNPQKHDNKNHEALIKKLIRYQDLSAVRILDVGCGSGKFVLYLRSKEYEVYGLEPSQALYNRFLSNDEFFYNKDVESFLQQQPGLFDVIIVNDVLEHIEDPVGFFQGIDSMLREKGILFISTPDTGSISAQLLGRKWHYYNKYHLSLFNRSNISHLMARHNLNCLETGHLTRYQSLHYILQYGVNFLMGSGRKVPVFMGNVNLPVNLYDTMYVVCRKEPVTGD